MVFVTWYVEGKLLQVRVASLRLLQVRVLPGVRERATIPSNNGHYWHVFSQSVVARST